MERAEERKQGNQCVLDPLSSDKTRGERKGVGLPFLAGHTETQQDTTLSIPLLLFPSLT